jgi:hypothetical protein
MGTESTTFWLVALCLNQLCHCVPRLVTSILEVGVASIFMVYSKLQEETSGTGRL